MAAEPSYKIFIRGISPTVDENGLELAFSKYGRIMEVLLLRDKETKASRGLGFITFECTEDCEDAVRGMNGQELKGSILQVEIATEKPGYQNNPRGRGFVRGGRGGFTGRGVEPGRFPARGGRPFGPTPPNRHPPVRGRGSYPRGSGTFESQRERFPGPAEYGDGRQPYPGPDMRREYRPHMTPNVEPMGYRAPTTPRYSYPDRPEGPRGPEGDYEGRAATWSRQENSDRRPERGYPPNADPEYSQRNPESAYDADYDSVDRRGYEAGYGLVDRRTSEGYPPPPREERADYGYSVQADYREYPNSDWNGEYNTVDRAATERRPPLGRGYGTADSDRYKSAESRGYGIEDNPESRVTEPDRAYRIGTGDAQRSKRGYPSPMDPYAASEDYGGREQKPDYRNPDLRRGYGGGGPVNPREYGYGPVEEVESRGTSDWEYRAQGSARHLERGEIEDTSGPQRGEYGRAEPGFAHRSYPAKEDYRRPAPGPESRAYDYPDRAQYGDWEVQEDEFTYEDRRGQRNPAPRSRGYPADPELDTSGDYVYPDQALGRSQGRPYGAYGSVSAHSEGFSGGRPTRGLPRGSRGSDSGLRHPPPRTNADEPEAKRRYAPETRGGYAASRGGRMPLRGSGRRAGRH